MQLLWHCLVNVSFGYLMLIATVRIVQEVMVLGSSMSKRYKIGSRWNVS
jgi:hypothetical protein